MEFLQDPNVLYLLLMAGLWISATGTYIPGTGLAEIGGAALVVGTLFLLAQMATTAYQAVWDDRWASLKGTDRDPGRRTVDTCYAYRADGPLVRERYPDLYTGAKDGHVAE